MLTRNHNKPRYEVAEHLHVRVDGVRGVWPAVSIGLHRNGYEVPYFDVVTTYRLLGVLQEDGIIDGWEWDNGALHIGVGHNSYEVRPLVMWDRDHDEVYFQLFGYEWPWERVDPYDEFADTVAACMGPLADEVHVATTFTDGEFVVAAVIVTEWGTREDAAAMIEKMTDIVDARVDGVRILSSYAMGSRTYVTVIPAG